VSDRSLIVLPRADQDAIEIYATIAADNPAAADRFSAALQSEYMQLKSFPHMGRATEFQGHGLRGLRSCPLSVFPSWLIFYRVTRETVEIVRVLHGARDLRRALRT
jgi:toxin ParE1/3/4